MGSMRGVGLSEPPIRPHLQQSKLFKSLSCQMLPNHMQQPVRLGCLHLIGALFLAGDNQQPCVCKEWLQCHTLRDYYETG